MNKNILNYLVILFFSILFSIYIFEYYLNLTTYQKSGVSITKNELKNKIQIFEKQFNKKYDTRSFVDIYKENNYSNKIFFPTIAGKKEINFNNKRIFPLAGHSHIKNIFCNENGYYSNFESDRYGFNNNDENWNLEKIDFLLLGDSFIHGMCVNKPDDISSQLEILSEGFTLNLSYGGNGPLNQYASLKEYTKNKKISNILWFFFEGNDLLDLNVELKNDILLNYLLINNYQQNLINFQEIIDKHSLNNQNQNFNRMINFKTKLKKIVFPYKTKKFINNLLNRKNEKKYHYEQYEKILSKALRFSNINSSKLIFVYLPEYSRYSSNYKVDNIKREKILKIVENLNIPIIDIHDELFTNETDKLQFFPLRNNGHYNELGYAKIAKIIYNKINNDEF